MPSYCEKCGLPFAKKTANKLWIPQCKHQECRKCPWCHKTIFLGKDWVVDTQLYDNDPIYYYHPKCWWKAVHK